MVNVRALIWLLIFAVTLIWSAVNPRDYLIWALEVAPAVIALVLLAATYRRFTFTPLVYLLILVHCIILMVGGHYTYAEVPLFDNLFGAERNNYDKLGHLAQGFVPAMAARELLLRLKVVNGRWWLMLFVIALCLAFSAFYEMIEWWVALLSGEEATAFLGTQGYEWDTQSDMAFALVGAITALVTLGRMHDGQIAKVVRG